MCNNSRVVRLQHDMLAQASHGTSVLRLVGPATCMVRTLGSLAQEMPCVVLRFLSLNRALQVQNQTAARLDANPRPMLQQAEPSI
jgi:hypothetical protein